MDVLIRGRLVMSGVAVPISLDLNALPGEAETLRREEFGLIFLLIDDRGGRSLQNESQRFHGRILQTTCGFWKRLHGRPQRRC